MGCASRSHSNIVKLPHVSGRCAKNSSTCELPSEQYFLLLVFVSADDKNMIYSNCRTVYWHLNAAYLFNSCSRYMFAANDALSMVRAHQIVLHLLIDEGNKWENKTRKGHCTWSVVRWLTVARLQFRSFCAMVLLLLFHASFTSLWSFWHSYACHFGVSSFTLVCTRKISATHPN